MEEYTGRFFYGDMRTVKVIAYNDSEKKLVCLLYNHKYDHYYCDEITLDEIQEYHSRELTEEEIEGGDFFPEIIKEEF